MKIVVIIISFVFAMCEWKMKGGNSHRNFVFSEKTKNSNWEISTDDFPYPFDHSWLYGDFSMCMNGNLCFNTQPCQGVYPKTCCAVLFAVDPDTGEFVDYFAVNKPTQEDDYLICSGLVPKDHEDLMIYLSGGIGLNLNNIKAANMTSKKPIKNWNIDTLESELSMVVLHDNKVIYALYSGDNSQDYTVSSADINNPFNIEWSIEKIPCYHESGNMNDITHLCEMSIDEEGMIFMMDAGVMHLNNIYKIDSKSGKYKTVELDTVDISRPISVSNEKSIPSYYYIYADRKLGYTVNSMDKHTEFMTNWTTILSPQPLEYNRHCDSISISVDGKTLLVVCPNGDKDSLIYLIDSQSGKLMNFVNKAGSNCGSGRALGGQEFLVLCDDTFEYYQGSKVLNSWMVQGEVGTGPMIDLSMNFYYCSCWMNEQSVYDQECKKIHIEKSS